MNIPNNKPDYGSRWIDISVSSRRIRLDELIYCITEDLGDDGFTYIDTTISDMPPDVEYEGTLMSIIEAREIMVSLGIKRLQMPT